MIQVQVIIPYTSKHTPVPFQPLRDQNYGRKVSYGATADSARDNYVGEESRGKIKVTDLPPDFSRNLQTWPATVSAISPEEVTGKPAGSQANNSIDVHRLQKNIDNWTIQACPMSRADFRRHSQPRAFDSSCVDWVFSSFKRTLYFLRSTVDTRRKRSAVELTKLAITLVQRSVMSTGQITR